MAGSKPVWTPIYDAARAVEIQAKKWKETHPTWQVRNGVLWVLKDDKDGKTRCQK